MCVFGWLYLDEFGGVWLAGCVQMSLVCVCVWLAVSG